VGAASRKVRTTPRADHKKRQDPLADGFERIEVDRVGPADEDARRVAEHPYVPLCEAVRLEVSFDPRSRWSLLDASKNLGRRGLLRKHPEPDGREVDDMQARGRSRSAARDVERARRPGKLLVDEGEEMTGDGGDVERAVTLTRPHARSTASGSMNGDHVGLRRPAAARKPNPASLKGLASDCEPKHGEAHLDTDDTLLERDALRVSLGKEDVAEVASLTRKGHRPA